jgi:hypothetical protein
VCDRIAIVPALSKDIIKYPPVGYRQNIGFAKIVISPETLSIRSVQR